MSTAVANSTEVSRALHNLSVMPGWNTTTDKATARKILETEWVFCNGYIRYIRVKHLGVGVYKVYAVASATAAQTEKQEGAG